MVTELRARVLEALDGVADPEIPAVSVADMGMIGDVAIDGDKVTVVLLPTFVGCPAVREIERDIVRAVEGVAGARAVSVRTSFEPPWTTARITERGRRRLAQYGIAPPQGGGVLITDIVLPAAARCPFCGGRNTRNESAFGPTPCRALYYCLDCRNPFEQFKPV